MEILISSRRPRSAHARLTCLKISCRNLSTGSCGATRWTGAFLNRDIHVMGVLRVLSDHRNTVEGPLHVVLLMSLASRDLK
jgi:hypothetical protein